MTDVQLERIANALENLVVAIASAATLAVPQEAQAQIAGVAAPPAAVTTSAQLPAQAPPNKGASSKKPPKTQPAATSAAPDPATAPAQAAGAPLPAAPAGASAADSLLKTATDAVIALANDFEGGRDQALAILAKRRGVTRCSDLKPEEVQGVLDDAVAAYAVHKQKANTAALI